MRILLFGTIYALALAACGDPVEPVMGISREAVPTVMTYQDINSWTEGDNFYTIGIATSGATGPTFERVSLELEVLDAAGQALTFEGRPSLSMPLFSEALPPLGRSAFFATWPVKGFSGKPASFRVKNAWAVRVPAGPILEASAVENTKMTLRPKGETGPGSDAWQVAAQVLNRPDQMPAAATFEVLLYGPDDRLWSAHRYSTADGIRALSQAKEGPLQPGEKRRVSRLVKREDLPEPMREAGIVRADVLTSEDR